MGQIFKPNFTYDPNEGWMTRFQYHWAEHTTACGRPPADYNLAIACYTQAGGGSASGSGSGSGSGGPSWTGGSFGAAADLFEQCCPPHGSSSGSGELATAYRADYSCRTVWCYTSSEALARGYGACVDRVARRRIAELGGGGGDGDGEAVARNASAPAPGEAVFGARCEWVDYTSLRKGIMHVQRSGAGRTGSGDEALGGRWRGGTAALTAALAGLAVAVVTGGLV